MNEFLTCFWLIFEWKYPSIIWIHKIRSINEFAKYNWFKNSQNIIDLRICKISFNFFVIVLHKLKKKKRKKLMKIFDPVRFFLFPDGVRINTNRSDLAKSDPTILVTDFCWASKASYFRQGLFFLSCPKGGRWRKANRLAACSSKQKRNNRQVGSAVISRAIKNPVVTHWVIVGWSGLVSSPKVALGSLNAPK